MRVNTSKHEIWTLVCNCLEISRNPVDDSNCSTPYIHHRQQTQGTRRTSCSAKYGVKSGM